MDPGHVVAERFEIEREIGSGGMGRVYQARDRETGDLVALKVLRPGSAPNAGNPQRFAREAAALAEVAHPATVRYVGHGALDDGGLWLAMTWVEGETLAKRLARTERLTVGDAIAVVRRVASALGAAHEKKIVHRDVKPSNVVLEGGDPRRAVLIDFGLARLGGASDLTRTGVAVGTPQYLSPEQARGSRRVDARADVYALGVLLFRCVTGRLPFRADDVLALFAKVLLEPAPRLSDYATVPRELDALCARLLSKSPEDRPKAGSAVATELDAIPALDEQALPIVSAPPKLTAAEQRVLSVILTPPREGSAPVIDEDAETVVEPAAREGSLAEIARAFGGSLEVLATGAVVVTLAGAGGAIERAGRAARCALRMRAALPGVRVVLATGRGVVSDRALVGDVIERSARLVATPACEGVRVDELTASLLDRGSGSGFEVGGDDAGLFVLRERPADPAPRLLGVATPCVGRERDLQYLFGAWSQCCEDGAARAVVVIGEAGMGKSRVRDELLRRVEESGGPGEVWFAQGDPMRVESPFGMLGDAVRGASGVREDEPAAVRRRKLRARVARHVPAADVARVTEFLGEISGAAVPGDASALLEAARRTSGLFGDQVRRALEDFASAECAQGPVLLVLEDLHWADPATVVAVDQLLRNLAQRPLLVLAFARPTVHDAYPRLWAGRACDVLRLGELSRKASERLVRAVLPDAADAIVERAIDLAQGNAFYLEELVRAMAEGQTSLPDGVLATVQTRLDALDPEARRILRAASVFGQTFWEGAVASLLPADESSDGLRAWLDFLCDREVIGRVAESRFGAERELALRHAIVREAAYAMLTDDDRALGHALAADWLEARGERPAVLAEHRERAGDRSGAALQFERAARHALDASDMKTVLAMADRAIACGAGGEARGRLDLMRAEVLWWRGDLEDAERAAKAAMAALPEASPLHWAAMGHLVGSWGKRGLRAPILELGRDLLARAALGELDDRQLEVVARVVMSLSYDLATRDVVEPYVVWLEEALAEGAVTDVAARARVHQALGMHAGNLNRWGACVESFRAAVRDFEAVGDRRNAVLMESNFGVALCFLGRYAQAREVFERALAVAESLGTEFLHASLLSDIGQTHSLEGRHAEAEAALRRAAEFFAKDPKSPVARNNAIALATCLVAGGKVDEAVAIGRPIAEECEGALEWKALALLAEAALASGDPTTALARVDEARAVFERAGGRHVEEAHLVRVRVDALLAAGRRAEARAEAVRGRALVLEHAATMDEELRAGFLAVPDHARVCAVAEQPLHD